MPDQDLSPIGRRLTILIGLSVLAILFGGLTLSVYRNAMFEQTLQNLAESNARLRRAIEEARVELDYYRSAQYKDKAAKEYLSRLNPGEKVLIIAEAMGREELRAKDDPSLQELRDAAYREYLRETPVWEHWKLYLFDREGLDELKSAFF